MRPHTRGVLTAALLGLAGIATLDVGRASAQGNLVVPLEGNPPVDPQLAVSPPTITGPGEAKANAYATACKLANFPDRPGRRGEQLVPEVAKNRFQLSDRGRTYTFGLRRGFRFNTGAPVRAANFVEAFNRTANPRMDSPGAAYMHEIKGADAVIHGRASRVAGVRALGRYRLQIRLTKNAPDLLQRLTL